MESIINRELPLWKNLEKKYMVMKIIFLKRKKQLNYFLKYN